MSSEYARMTELELRFTAAHGYLILMRAAGHNKHNRNAIYEIICAARRELERRGKVQYWWERAEEQEALL